MRQSVICNPHETMTYLANTASATEAEALWELLCARMKEHGFDRLFYAATRLVAPLSPKPDAHWIVFSSHRPAYTSRYLAEAICSDCPDALTPWHAQHTPPGTTDAGPAWQGGCGAAARVADLGHVHGIEAGFTIDLGAPDLPGRGVIGLTARPGLDQRDVSEIWSRLCEVILTEIEVFHLKMLSLPSGPYRLTVRQREVLELTARGYTVCEAAKRLRLMPTTVEKHLRLAREELGAATTAQAVFRATLYGQINVRLID